MRKGQIAKIYTDWQNNEGPYEEGELLQKISEGLPFILSENSSKIYSWEVWKVKTRTTIRVAKIRKLIRRASPEPLPVNLVPPIKDTFLKVGNKEIF